MKLRRIQCTGQLLTDALQLPDGTKIHDLRYLPDTNAFEFKVEHPSFDDVPGGKVLPLCNIYFQVDFHYCPVDKSTWKRYQASWGDPVWT